MRDALRGYSNALFLWKGTEKASPGGGEFSLSCLLIMWLPSNGRAIVSDEEHFHLSPVSIFLVWHGGRLTPSKLIRAVPPTYKVKWMVNEPRMRTHGQAKTSSSSSSAIPQETESQLPGWGEGTLIFF